MDQYQIKYEKTSFRNLKRNGRLIVKYTKVAFVFNATDFAHAIAQAKSLDCELFIDPDNGALRYWTRDANNPTADVFMCKL